MLAQSCSRGPDARLNLLLTAQRRRAECASVLLTVLQQGRPAAGPSCLRPPPDTSCCSVEVDRYELAPPSYRLSCCQHAGLKLENNL